MPGAPTHPTSDVTRPSLSSSPGRRRDGRRARRGAERPGRGRRRSSRRGGASRPRAGIPTAAVARSCPRSGASTRPPSLRLASQSTVTGTSSRASRPNGSAVASRDTARTPSSRSAAAVAALQRFQGGTNTLQDAEPKAALIAARPRRRSARTSSIDRDGPNSLRRPLGSWFTCAQPCWWSAMPRFDRSIRRRSATTSARSSSAGMTARSIGVAGRVKRSSSAHSRSSPQPTSSSRKKNLTGPAAASSRVRSGSSHTFIPCRPALRPDRGRPSRRPARPYAARRRGGARARRPAAPPGPRGSRRPGCGRTTRPPRAR